MDCALVCRAGPGLHRGSRLAGQGRPDSYHGGAFCGDRGQSRHKRPLAPQGDSGLNRQLDVRPAAEGSARGV